MTTQHQRNNRHSKKMYWKDALRQTQAEMEIETPPAHNRKWTSAYRQAQEDMEDPGAVVWLPDEIAAAIRQAEAQQDNEAHPSKNPPQFRLSLTTLLLGALFLLPVAMSYLRAYRQVTVHTR